MAAEFRTAQYEDAGITYAFIGEHGPEKWPAGYCTVVN